MRFAVALATFATFGLVLASARRAMADAPAEAAADPYDGMAHVGDVKPQRPAAALDRSDPWRTGAMRAAGPAASRGLDGTDPWRAAGRQGATEEPVSPFEEHLRAALNAAIDANDAQQAEEILRLIFELRMAR